MSTTKLPPLRFVPWVRPMVWGASNLTGSLGKVAAAPGNYGESWELSDHPQHASIVANGEIEKAYAGQSLRDLVSQNPEAILGYADAAHGERFPLLVKWLDAADWLSVQVHPDTEAVKRLLPGEGSKTEAWFVIKADPKSRIWAGLKPGVGEAEMRAAIASGNSADCLHSFTPQSGQFLFLPAGTVHAVGGGVLMAEIQQTSDATFRLFDWNRVDAHGKSRPLHIEESIGSVHWDKGPVNPITIPGFGTSTEPLHLDLCHCPFFRLAFERIAQPMNLGVSLAPKIVMVLGGKGQLQAGGKSDPLRQGDTFLLPAECDPVTLVPDGVLELWIAATK